MSPRTARRVQARETARKRIEEARAARRERDRAEEQQTIDFELARQRRDGAVHDAANAELDMAAHVRELLRLGNKVDQVATLTGEPEQEVRRLQRLRVDQPPVRRSAKQSNPVSPRQADASSPAALSASSNGQGVGTIPGPATRLPARPGA